MLRANPRARFRGNAALAGRRDGGDPGWPPPGAGPAERRRGPVAAAGRSGARGRPGSLRPPDPRPGVCLNWWEARAWGRLSGVDHIFTIDEARQLLSEVRSRAEDLIAVRADLVEIRQALSDGSPSPLGGLAEAKALEARMSELLGWFPASG